MVKQRGSSSKSQLSAHQEGNEADEESNNNADADDSSVDEFLFDSYEAEDFVSGAELSSFNGHAAILPNASLALGLRCVLFEHIEDKKRGSEIQRELDIRGRDSSPFNRKLPCSRIALKMIEKTKIKTMPSRLRRSADCYRKTKTSSRAKLSFEPSFGGGPDRCFRQSRRSLVSWSGWP